MALFHWIEPASAHNNIERRMLTPPFIVPTVAMESDDGVVSRPVGTSGLLANKCC